MLRSSGKRPHVEDNDENADPNVDLSRPPLNAITGAVVNTGGGVSDAVSGKRKVERTPSKKRQFRGHDSPLRTPEKSALVARNRFGWGGLLKNDSGSSSSENCDEVGGLPPLGRGGGVFASGTPRTGRNVGKASSESGSVQSTPTKSVGRVRNTGLGWSRPGMGGGSRIGNFAAASRGLPIASSPSTVVNSVDVCHFELREEPAFWMEHNVQVVIRVRPLNGTELSMQGYNRCLKQEGSHSISWIGQPEARFIFDHVACETINQESLFRVVGLPMVENCMSGYNSCIFAYGQTGSGKTYTMLGDLDDLEVRPSIDRGMTPRIFEFLFARIRAEEESRRDEKLKYNCKCSFLEIYNEQITDLLDPSSTNLLLREDVQKGVYVENLTEFVVENTNDIVKLLVQGAANRKVAATNMNRESSRSHSVFTCVIESTWEKDSLTNLRFARLNLVDLAGSERQKMSGAEGERLKEAASINKSLSTLGHVIMVLVDMAHGKLRHVPYRDSRLTFLLQDSLGGNSKTMIIANVSPSVSCASETLSTLRFAQRAKFIQNNAFVNEDASGDVIALQHQIRLLKEEISILRRQNVSRSLSFQTAVFKDFDVETCEASDVKKLHEDTEKGSNNLHKNESSGSLGVSTKQLKSLEVTLVGALRREKIAETTNRQLEAEIEQLNRLVRQREDDIQCTKMVLKFREDKIQRMEALVDGLVSGDSYALEERCSLAKEVQLLQDRVDRNPEVTRFALENIRLLDQLRRFQDFYEEGERELLLAEVSELRSQLVQFLEGKTQLYKHPTCNSGTQEDTLFSSGVSLTENNHLEIELKKAYKELEDCRNNLKSCLEVNERLTREMDDFRSELNHVKPVCKNQFVPGEPVDMELCSGFSAHDTKYEGKIVDRTDDATMQNAEKIVNLQLELDILKIILGEEKLYRSSAEDKAFHMSNNLALAEEKISLLTKNYEDTKIALKDAEAVIEALESQQILSINETEELRTKYSVNTDLLTKQAMEITSLRKKLGLQANCEKTETFPCQNLKKEQFEHSESDRPLRMKLNRLQASLDKALSLTLQYQSDCEAKTSHEQEMDEICEQVEAETAEVIVYLQEEVQSLQQEVCDSKRNETEARESLMVVETEFKIVRERLCSLTRDNEQFMELLEEKDKEVRSLTEEWEAFVREIGEVLAVGNLDLETAVNQVNSITNGLPYKAWIGDQIGRIVRTIPEKDALIGELQKSLEGAQNVRCDLEWKLRSLQGATLAITEEQQKENIDKDREIFLLTSQLSDKKSIISELEDGIKKIEDQMKKAELRATVAFLTVSRLSDINSVYLEELKAKRLQLIEFEEVNFQKDAFVQEQISLSASSEELIQSLKLRLVDSERNAADLHAKLDKKQEQIFGMESQLEKVKKDFEAIKCTGDLLKVEERLNEFNHEMSTLQSCMDEYNKGQRKLLKEQIPEMHAVDCANYDPGDRIKSESNQCISKEDSINFHAVATDYLKSSAIGNVDCSNGCKGKLYFCEKQELKLSKGVYDTETTILLLKKEIESAFQCLGGVQAQMSRLLDEEKEIKQYNVRSRMDIEALTAEIHRMEMEMIHKEKILEGKAEESAKVLNETKMDLMFEISDATRLAAEKDFEASIFLSLLKEVQGEVKQYNVWSRMSVEALTAEVHSMEVEMIHKAKVLESRLLELHHKVQLVEGMAEDSANVLNETKMDLMLEVSDATRLAAEKDFEASILLYQFKEAQGEMIEANFTLNALTTANEAAKFEVQSHLETEKVLTSERDKLSGEVCRLNSLLAMMKQEFDLVEKKFQSSMIDLEVVATSVQSMFTQVQTSFMQDFKSLSCYLDSLKSEFHHLTHLKRMWLEDLWSEIIGKDCAVFVLLLCQTGMFLEKTTALTADTRSLHRGLYDLHALISDLREQNNKAKEEAEMCMVLKGKLLVDINNSLSFAMKECETADLKARLSIIDEKVLESDLQEELPLAKFYTLTEELGVFMKEQEDNGRNAMAEMLSKDLDILVLSLDLRERNGGLKQKTSQIAHFENQAEAFDSSIEKMQREAILSTMEGEFAKQMLMELEIEVTLLRQQISDAHIQLDLSSHDSHSLMKELKQSSEKQLQMEMKVQNLEHDCHERIVKELDLTNQIKWQKTIMDEKSKELNNLIERFEVLTSENSTLNSDLNEASEKDARLLVKIQILENENAKILEDLQLTEVALEASVHTISAFNQENQKLQDDVSSLQAMVSKLQHELERRNVNINELQCYSSNIAKDLDLERNEAVNLYVKLKDLQNENDRLINEATNLSSENSRANNELREKQLELESSSSHVDIVDAENHRLQHAICTLHSSVSNIEAELCLKNKELDKIRSSYSIMSVELALKNDQNEQQIAIKDALESENESLRLALTSISGKMNEVVALYNVNQKNYAESIHSVLILLSRISQILSDKHFTMIDGMLSEISENENIASKFITELEFLEMCARNMLSENFSLQTQSLEKDEVSKGLLFKLRVLQESTSTAQHQKVELEELASRLQFSESALASKSDEVDDLVAQCHILEAQLLEKCDRISTLEMDLAKERCSLKLISGENLAMNVQLEDILQMKNLELEEKDVLIGRSEKDVIEMKILLDEQKNLLNSLQNDVAKLAEERSHFDSDMFILKEQLEMAHALAEENEAIATEVRQIAESRKASVEEKEEEVKLLEKSIEELERTINMLQNKVEIVKDEAERQRLQREELEIEVQAVKHQLLEVKTCDKKNVIDDVPGHCKVQECEVKEVENKVQLLQKDIEDKNVEISQYQEHILELNMHAEAQARQNAQKIKELEMVVDKLKTEPSSSIGLVSTASRCERSSVKPRGSSSPFKCIGLGLAQQVNSEKEEELTSGRLRIQELESLIANQRKEIFSLNSRLAASESMTHDVIRDLLGVKLDIAKYASLVDNQQLQMIMESSCLQREDFLDKEHETIKLKKQLNEFIEERQAWLDELNRRHSEMVATKLALEKLRQHDQFLTTENEVLKADNMRHKKMVMQLEDEVKKLYSQQNLQSRIHHHAKIKEENNMLKVQKQDLATKLQKSEEILSSVRAELSAYRSSSGKKPYADVDEEQGLRDQLANSEKERIQVAQKLLSLCTSVLKVAGITEPSPEVSPSLAEEALHHLEDEVHTLRSEMQDLTFKNKICCERMRLFELGQRSFPFRSKKNEEFFR